MHRIITICNYQNENLNFKDEIQNMNQLCPIQDKTNIQYSISKHCCMSYNHTSCNQEIFTYHYHNQIYKIMYIGNIYNLNFIKEKLIEKGYIFQTKRNEEIILLCYIHYGKEFLNHFNGGFVIIIDNQKELFVARDQLGIIPLYYTFSNHTLVISNEIKCLLAYLKKAVVDKQGLIELLSLGPSMTPGTTIYKDIYSLRPGFYMTYQKELELYCYWRLKEKTHTDTLSQTIQKVRCLIENNIKLQIQNENTFSTMLSGGLDSSIITAIIANTHQPLDTYSITYQDQDKYFQSYDYQTSMDDNYIQQMVNLYKTNHHVCTLTQQQLIDSLKDALIARDMPGMADIDSSFLLFSKFINQKHTIAFSGECADEIFGGYPWFYKEELYNQPYFPWMRELDKKLELFNKNIQNLQLKDHIQKKYQESLQESMTANKNQQLIYLNIQWFMQTLLTRAYTQSLYSSLDIRVPFASVEIVEYLYNMPRDFMFYNKEEKGILRRAFEDVLPPDIAHRKKNPFPKTHSPIYKELIYQKLKESLQDPSNILYILFDKEKLYNLIESRGESFQYPWYGQLMMGPQLMAYFYQIYLWSKIYHIELDI